MIQDLINILEKVKEKITNSSDMGWSSHETAETLRKALEKYISALKEGENSYLDNVNTYFLPTGTFQEHAINNSWAKEYLKLAEEFDRIFAKLKN